MTINAVQTTKTVADPLALYDSMHPLWARNRAVCSGERFVKEYDDVIDVNNFKNLLIPFSPSMNSAQYNFYKAEAELPGVVAQYSRMVVGGLLRKKPQLTLPEGVPAEVKDWILSQFGEDNCTLSAFLDKALWEELQTSRCWIYVDHPTVPEADSLTREEMLEYKPYPVIWKAESVINWTITRDAKTGVQTLSRVIMRKFEEDFNANEFHANLVDTVVVHDLDANGFYRIRKYQVPAPTIQAKVIGGKTQTDYTTTHPTFELVDTIENIMSNGERLTEIPAWPLNGSIEISEPIITQLVDKEVALYNKISRRNHLLYGAATYTPIIASDMTDSDFKQIVDAGLGSWIKLMQGDTASVLETPTTALADMDRAIASAFEEMAKLGVRMLSPEVSQSGVALDIRNASQTAQLGTLNMKVSVQMCDIIAFMINWRYGTELTAADIDFSMSCDFNPAPLGADWLRLITEWYQAGLIPRSIWLQILKQNDILDPEYDDKEGQVEISQDDTVISPVDEMNMNIAMQQQQNAALAAGTQAVQQSTKG